jgi:hypothetical protein
MISAYAHVRRNSTLSHSLYVVYSNPRAIVVTATRAKCRCGHSEPPTTIIAIKRVLIPINKSPPVQCRTEKATSDSVAVCHSV